MSLAVEASQRRRRRFQLLSAGAEGGGSSAAVRTKADAEALERLRTRIRTQASSFELPALLAALQLLGYPLDRIRLVSQRSLLSPSGLVQAVHFPEQPQLPVELHLNFGLLSPDGPLPSYFSKLFQAPELNGDLLQDFLHAFDHELLFRHVQGLAPVHAPRLMPLHEALLKLLLPMLRPSSPATLEWVLRKVFPELVVQLKRKRGSRQVHGDALVLGRSALSRGETLGGQWQGQSSCLSVYLTAAEVVCIDGRLWQEVVRERLTHTVLPLLSQTETLLELVLVLPGEPSAIRLEPEGPRPRLDNRTTAGSVGATNPTETGNAGAAARAESASDTPSFATGDTRLGYQALKTPPAGEVELLIYRGCPRDQQHVS